MPNQPKTPVRSHRIPDEEYLPAVAKGKAEGLTSGTAVMRMLLRKYVTGALAVACFVGSGVLAYGYFQPEPAAPATTQIDQTKVWNDLQQRADQLRRDMQQQGPAIPTPAPTRDTERSV